MRKLLAICMASFMLLAVPACGTLGTALGVATSSQPAGDIVTFDERGMIAVEILYNVPAQAYVTADTRELPGWAGIKPTVRPLLIEARRWLLLVREAYRLGDERTFRDRVARLQSLRDQIMARIPAAN